MFASAPPTPTLSPGKPGEREQVMAMRSVEDPLNQLWQCEALRIYSVGSLSPGYAGGEGWGEGALLVRRRKLSHFPTSAHSRSRML